MNGSLQNLAGKIRQAFGNPDAEASVLNKELQGRPGGLMLRKKRIKIAIAAILFGLISSVIEMPLPLEDLYRAARAQLRAQPAPQDIAFIAIDDRTMQAFSGKIPGRENDARVVDNLFRAGVKKVTFDRAHADPGDTGSDAVFAQMLERHKGKVWLGFSPTVQIGMQSVDEMVPLPAFRKRANIAAMNGYGTPFGLSVSFGTEVELHGERYPSLSAVLADYDGQPMRYRPDYAFIPSTIPTFSFVDVLNGKVGAAELRGKNVIVGESFVRSTDFYIIPFSSERIVPGAYFHIMGAHTLKRSITLDLGWVPAVLLTAFAIIWQVVERSRTMTSMGLVMVSLLSVPVLLDEFGINIDVMSAVLALAGAMIGFHRLNRKYYSSEANAMTTSAISSDKPSSERDVFALKIANLAEMSEDWSARETGDFVNTLIGYVQGPGEVGDVAFERDMLVWLAPRMEVGELERHADGLALMLKTAINHDWQSSNGAPALGIDTNYDLAVGLRIKKAMQAANEAATRGLRFVVNDAAYLEARNHRLELIRVLEKGLRDRAVGVAYQPKIDLASGRIVGAETLIRWRPEGRELVNAQELVLAAEAADLINELTLVVMESALVEGKRAIALDPRFKLAVNMSAKSLSDTHLLFDIMTMLGRLDFPPENLTLELTETAKLDDQRIAPQVAALKQRGICLSIDDFGTGQSNLEYIETLPSSELKIDKRFVQHMATSEESRAVVRATIEIAHSLGKVVVAEGVEDVAVADTLREMGCDQAQGYLFSAAISMSDLLAAMGDRRIAIND